MKPKVAAAIITGTMARPSRPSVRFTALPAADDDERAEQDEERAEVEQHVLEERQRERRREARGAPTIASSDVAGHAPR